jgi:hypothetical protein
MSERTEQNIFESPEMQLTHGTDSNSANGNRVAADDAAISKLQPSTAAAVDPFDPMNLGIPTDYAAAINAKASSKPFELRKPNDQEFFCTSPRKNHRLVVGSITDKQDMGKLYIVPSVLLEEVRTKFPKAVRGVELVLAQTLAGAWLVWPVPLAEDRGGKWNSTQRAGSEQGKTRWTNMTSGRGQYDVITVNNPKAVDWDSVPPFRDVLEQACSERLVDSLEHALLRKLRGETE